MQDCLNPPERNYSRGKQLFNENPDRGVKTGAVGVFG